MAARLQGGKIILKSFRIGCFSVAKCNDNDTVVRVTQHKRSRTMTIEKACDILGYDPSRPIEHLKQLAAVRKSVLAVSAPLKCKVAISVILGA